MLIVRLLLTALVLGAWRMSGFIFNTAATLVQGQTAGMQFDPSNVSYVGFEGIRQFFAYGPGSGFIGPIAILLIFLIWLGAIKKGVHALTTAAVACVCALSLIGMQPARAYYDTTDKTEAYTILPNESAFWVPDVGNNVDTQANLDSAAYLEKSKIAAKRFIIPHAKLTGSGGWGQWDAYVPTGRLIIVDRTPYARSWVKQASRGTSKSDDSFPCQSKEGINITAGVALAASVRESQVATFLYNFGVSNDSVQGSNRNDPQLIFRSVYNGRSLTQVMDTFGHEKISALVCREIGARTFDQANAEMNQIMDVVTTESDKYFASYGVTINFIGWADTLSFDDSIQKAINDKYAAMSLQPMMPTLAALAQLKVQEGFGAGLAAKGAPMIITPDFITALTGVLKSVQTVTGLPVAAH